MNVNSGSIFYALALAGKGGVRFIVLWVFIAIWTLPATFVFAALSGIDAGVVIVYSPFIWLVLYAHALGIALWFKMR
jgi:hypothetical protein